jgi:hypothetical protein
MGGVNRSKSHTVATLNQKRIKNAAPDVAKREAHAKRVSLTPIPAFSFRPTYKRVY